MFFWKDLHSEFEKQKKKYLCKRNHQEVKVKEDHKGKGQGILRQHRVLRNLRKNKNVVIPKPDKGNGVVILDRELSNNAIEGIISDTYKFEKPNKVPTLKREASLQHFLRKLKQKTFLMKLNIISCILLVLLLLVSVVLLKCRNSPLVIHFLNFVRLFCLQVLLIITLPVSFVIFFHFQFRMITLAKIFFLLFLKLRMQIFLKNICFLRCNSFFY